MCVEEHVANQVGIRLRSRLVVEALGTILWIVDLLVEIYYCAWGEIRTTESPVDNRCISKTAHSYIQLTHIPRTNSISDCFLSV